LDRNVKRIISISAIVLFFCGWSGLATLWMAVKEIFIAFFPIFADAAKQSLEDYLTSRYFITGVIMFLLSSGFGIWVGKTGGKVIYLIVSIIAAIISLASIGSNIL
jgi:hypothetical protein